MSARSLRAVTIVELRRYTLHPGRREELIELFEREFVESQEAVGAQVVGTFRDVREPDRFVWIRAFADMTVRLQASARSTAARCGVPTARPPTPR